MIRRISATLYEIFNKRKTGSSEMSNVCSNILKSLKCLLHSSVKTQVTFDFNCDGYIIRNNFVTLTFTDYRKHSPYFSCIGFLVVVLEAPCCCPFFDFVDKIGKFSESRPYWQKGALYTL